jgi:hypothetical protein
VDGEGVVSRRRSAKRSPARRRRAPRKGVALPWRRWPTQRLLDLRIRDLGVRIERTWLAACVTQLHEELAARGLRFRPHVWLSDDWFSPDRVPGIAIPFYLAHPRLMRLERHMLLDVEGGTHREAMQILRHEAGHAIQHAYQLQRRRRWQRLFGPSSKRYPEYYRPNPASRRYVQHLQLWYAQSHPAEDFAETFAVWLKPRSDWRRRYAGWPALRKLAYVDALMAEIADQRPVVASRARPDPAHRLSKTLREHYDERRARYTLGFPNIYDRDLRRLFSDRPEHRHREAASSFLRRNRREIRGMVARWTGEYQFTLDLVLGDMIGRCRELKLRAVGSERRLKLDFAVLLTVKTMHFLYSQGRRDWIAL